MIVQRRSFTYDYDDNAAQWHGRNGMPQRYTLEDYSGITRKTAETKPKGNIFNSVKTNKEHP